MSSKRETILAAVATLMSASPAASSNVYRSRLAAIASGSLPAIVVRPGDRDEPSEGAIGPVNRFLDLEVAIYMEGDVPDSLADATVIAAHNKIMNDRTIGGLAVDTVEGATQFAFDRGDKDSVEVKLNYRVHYRTSGAGLT